MIFEISYLERPSLKLPLSENFVSPKVIFLVTTGLRAGELLALEIKDINLKDDYLWIHHIEDTHTLEILDYVKENKSRQVYLSDLAKTIIHKTLEIRNQDDSNLPYLLLNKNSKDGKMHLRALDSYLRKTIHKKVLGLGKDRDARSPHDCRRTYASLEYINGTDIYTLKNQLGHSSIQQTEDYIKDIVDASERKARLKGIGV